MLTSPRIAGLTLLAYLEHPVESADVVPRLCELSAQVLGNPIVTILDSNDGHSLATRRQSLLDVECNSSTVVITYRARGLTRYKAYRVEELNWSLGVAPWHRGTHAEYTPATILMTLNLDLLAPADIARCNHIAKEYFDVIQKRGSIISGMGDVADFYETCLGRYHAETTISWIDPRRDLVRWLWARAQAKDKCVVRGIFWANYFGPRVVARLGGDAHALAGEYAAMDYYEDSDLTRVYDDGSIVFLLTASHKWFKYPFDGIPHQTHERYAWLHRRLKAAGLLP